MRTLKLEIELQGPPEKAFNLAVSLQSVIIGNPFVALEDLDSLRVTVSSGSRILLAEREGMMGVPIDELGLPTRCMTILERWGVETIGDLVTNSRKELLDRPNFGRKSLEDVERALASRGLSLR